MGKSKFIERGPSRLPFIEYLDECGNRYYVDILSKPWFYVFVSFRIFFPVDAYRIDNNIKKNDIEKIDKNMWIYLCIGTVISRLIKIILEQYAIDEGGVYSVIYQLVSISFIVLCILLMYYNKKKLKRRENLTKMNKVTIKLKISRKGIFHGLVSLVVLYVFFTLDFSGHTSISIYDVFAFICVGFLEWIFLILQWSCLEFSSKDVKTIE